MHSLISSRRGHIPTLLLLVEGLVLMVTVWFLFLSSHKHELQVLSQPVIQVIDTMHYRTQYVQTVVPVLVEQSLADVRDVPSESFESRFRAAFEARASEVDGLASQPATLLGLIVRSKNYTLEQVGKEVYRITIPNIVVSSLVDQHELIRTFDLSVSFNRTAVLGSA